MGSKSKSKHKKPKQHRASQFNSNNEAVAWSKGVDWDLWLEEFFLEEDKEGEYKYRTIDDFAESKGENEREIRWIRRSIGRKPRTGIPWQGNWQYQRESNRSKFADLSEGMDEKIASELELLTKSRQIAMSYGPWSRRVQEMVVALDTYMGGTAFNRPPKKWDSKKEEREWHKAQRARFQFYVSSLDKILNLKTRVDREFLHSMGFENNNIADVLAAMIKGRGEQGMLGSGSDEPRVKQILGLAIDSLIKKSKTYELPLPDDISEAIEEADKLSKAKNITPGVIKNGGNGKSNGKH